MIHDGTTKAATPFAEVSSSNLDGRTFTETGGQVGSKTVAKPRLTLTGRPAKAPYRKLVIGDEVRDEHRVVMERHIGRRLATNEVVHHLNGDTYDNRIENLSVMDLAEHSRLHQSGELGTNAKLRELQVVEILASLECSDSELGLRYGVARKTISDIRMNRTWKHIPR